MPDQNPSTQAAYNKKKDTTSQIGYAGTQGPTDPNSLGSYTDPNQATNPATGKPWVTPPSNIGAGGTTTVNGLPTAWGNAGASPLTNMGYFTNEPNILSRLLMRGYGAGMDSNGMPNLNGAYSGNVYAQDPFSQYLQNRFLSASTLGTYLAPSQDFDPRQQYSNAASYIDSLNNPFGAGGPMANIRNNVLPYMAKFNSGDIGGMFGDPNQAAQGAAALSLWKDPQADMRLVQAALGGLPSPLTNALGSMASTIYQMFQDKAPSLPGGETFLQWLMG